MLDGPGTNLEAPTLVVDIMIHNIGATCIAQPREWAEWQVERGVVFNSLDCYESVEENGFFVRQTDKSGRKKSAQCVNNEAFCPMVVQCSVGEGCVQLMVDRVDVACWSNMSKDCVCVLGSKLNLR